MAERYEWVSTPKWVWDETSVQGMRCIRLDAKECRIDIFPRPGYCDRGKWECHVVDPGFPTNPNPFDAADMFPRLFFDLARAKLEMEALFDQRGYNPK